MPLTPETGISCKSCRSRKRKCDKRRPQCSLCSSKDLHCVYSTQRRRRNPELLQHQNVFQQRSSVAPSQSHSLAPAVLEEPTNPGPGSTSKSSIFPSVLFLDFMLSRKYQVSVPLPSCSIPLYISSIIGDHSHIHAISCSYFETAHLWIPIISKKRFKHFNPLYPLRSDYALLILCMDLINWIPGKETEVRTKTYFAAKRYYLDLEIQGVMTIQALQAGILLAAFEIGHAIYPSAFMSVAGCARYGFALELDRVVLSSSENETCSSEAEEQNRTWWSIVLLDRIINIGQPGRPLLVPDPGVDAFLPGRDAEWDHEMPSAPRYTVATPTIKWGDMGPFALVAQASRLLGQVLRHVYEPSGLDEEEAILLDRTLRALAQVVDVESQLQDLFMMNQQAICSIALIMLHEAHASSPKHTKISAYFRDNHKVVSCNLDILKSVAAVPETREHISVRTCVKEASPFLVALLYQIAVVNERIYREKGTSETSKALDLIKMVLGKFSTRWKSAGAYLTIVEAKEM